MPIATYQEIHDGPMTGLIQTQFADEIAQLRALGFEEEMYIREQGHPLSFLLFMPDLVLDYLSIFECVRPILRTNASLRYIGYSPCFVHKDGFAYAIASYKQIKYVTMFDDGTLLHTVNHKRWARSDPKFRFVRQFCVKQTRHGTFEDTWALHRNKVYELASLRAVVTPLRMNDIIQMEMRADRIFFGMEPVPWNGTVAKRNAL